MQHLTHYEILEIPRNADEDQIKRAWARKVRIHSPDKDPEGNRRVNEARSTLIDHEARRNYDAQLDYGGELEEILNEAQEGEESEDWQTAIRAYKELLVLKPDDHEARDRLALCFFKDEEVEEAVKVLRELTRRAPNTALYWSNLGYCLQESSDSPSDIEECRKCFLRAIELEPFNASYHIALCRLERSAGNYVIAETHIENAVHADGAFDISDLEALFELPLLRLFSHKLEKLPRDVERILSVLPADDDDAKMYCAHKFLRSASELAEINAYSAAAEFVKAARQCSKDLGEAEEFATDVETFTTVSQELNRMKTDERVLKAILVLIIVRFSIDYEGMEKSEADERVKEMIVALNTWSANDINNSVHRIQSYYPATGRYCQSLLTHIRESGHTARMGGGYSENQPYAGSTGGCCIVPAFLITLLMGLACSFIVYLCGHSL